MQNTSSESFTEETKVDMDMDMDTTVAKAKTHTTKSNLSKDINRFAVVEITDVAEKKLVFAVTSKIKFKSLNRSLEDVKMYIENLPNRLEGAKVEIIQDIPVELKEHQYSSIDCLPLYIFLFVVDKPNKKPNQPNQKYNRLIYKGNQVIKNADISKYATFGHVYSKFFNKIHLNAVENDIKPEQIVKMIYYVEFPFEGVDKKFMLTLNYLEV